MYSWDSDVKIKIEIIVICIYGVEYVDYVVKVKKDFCIIVNLGLEYLVICVVKMQKFLLDNFKLLG